MASTCACGRFFDQSGSEESLKQQSRVRLANLFTQETRSQVQVAQVDIDLRSCYSMTLSCSTRVSLILLMAIGGLVAQPTGQGPAGGAGAAAQTPAGLPESQLRSTYVLGPDDIIVIRALEAEEINDKPVRVDMSGNIRLPLIGRVHAAGLTIEQLENALTESLKSYVKQPQLSVSVNEYKSQPVSVIGAVGTPGVHQLQGRKTLVEVLSLVGGVKEEAGPTVKITRQMRWGRIPLPNATEDSTGKVSIAEVSIRDIVNAKNPLGNILICPDDVISVPRAEIVYVIGEETKPGGYTLRERESMSVLQALSMAGGMSRAAGPKNAKLLRQTPGNGERTEIAVDLKKILAGQGKDTPMLPEDILLVPNNAPRSVALRSMEAALTIGTGLVLYRR